MAWKDHLKPLSNLVRSRPVMAVFEICLRCNSRCGYCDLPLNQGRYEMTRAEIRRMSRHLYQEGVRYIFVQGGEPLVRRDTLDVLEDMAETGLGLCLVTNGTKLNPDIVARLSSIGASVSVSLDTLDEERYRLIRGADQLSRVLRGIDALDGYPHPKFIACIVSDKNQADVTDVCRFARERAFVPILGAYHWDVGRYGKADATLQFSREQAARTFEAILDTDLLPGGYYRRFAEDNATWLRGGRLGRCDAGRYSIVIDASGNVAPCLAQPQAGNLRTESLRDILGAMDHDAVRECSNASSCNLLCGRLIGRNLRDPISALTTPMTVEADAR